MKSIILPIALFLAGSALAAPPSGSGSSAPGHRTTPIPSEAHASASDAASMATAYLQRLRVDALVAPIHSSADLTQYLKQHKKGTSPLDAMPPTERARFLTSLYFTGAGLGSFSYADLQNLTATQIFKIPSLFGVQADTPLIVGAHIVTPTDQAIMDMGRATTAAHPCPFYDYKCVRVGSCARYFNYICTCRC